MPVKQLHTRKEFIRTSTILVAGALALPGMAMGRKQPRLAFSTLGCPDWDFNRITEFAEQHGYTGIEVRGIQREMDLVKSSIFSSAEARKATMRRMKEKGLQFVGLGSSSTLHFSEAAQRTKQLDEGRRFIDLAAQINCPYVRVFPNNFPKNQEKQATMDLITRGLQELGNHAKGSGVTVLMETHGDMVWTADILQIMEAANHPQVALVWDVTNMWTITGEDPVEMYGKLKPYIRHVHVKDATKAGGKLNYTFLGKGEVPIMKAIAALRDDRYKGFYSFEWEKLWHPEIAEPDIALADYPAAIKQQFQ
ncbi:sugar phosphate isomerase/epimerase family protein [Flavihumibacter stibioxidans]|uniref:Xylose isomerase n=1 Tax=Flavihumibacter stibioxidans TaxID=1834163 RepID=A0ABR7M9E0_9BACT|nr:sugar phosphate isomerase/epimerase family protein [Flavihumibacter stibioxidans]MBC6491350.1 xylose isomerase [Flavihumibacter stibioxidans]